MNMDTSVVNKQYSNLTESSSNINKVTILVTIICWFAIFIEGYDLVVYGVVLPVLMEPSQWGISATQAGSMGSYALLGMFVGSSIGGALSDKFGRKFILVASIILLAIMMALTALSSTPEQFGVYRFIAGIGIGGLVPATAALTTEYSPLKYRSLVFVIMYSGFAFGGVAASISGMLFIDSFSWRSLFWLGALPIFLVPVIIKFLPESIQFLRATNQTKKANKIINKYNLIVEEEVEESEDDNTNSIKSVFSKEYRRSTIVFSLVYIMAFLLIYGMNTWLPKIMEEAGYPVTSSLAFLLVFNLSAVFGGLIAGWIADRVAPKKVISFTYVLATISILLLSIKFNIFVIYILIAIAGFGTTGTTFVLASYVMKQYESKNRATALGLSSAVGRFGAVAGPLLVGIIMSFQLGYKFNFYLFGAIGLIATILILFVPYKSSAERIDN